MRGSIRRWWLVVLVCVLAVGGACARPGLRQPARPNIVLAVIDTLRRDHLSCYGYERATSPFIDKLAESGTLFERAFAQAPWTASSMASIFTSRYPSEVGVGAVEGPGGLRHLGRFSATPLGSSAPTLAEELSAAGYDTIAVTANGWSADWVGMLRGFSRREESELSAEKVIDRVLRLLGEGLSAASTASSSPFFAYVHLVDPHIPTAPPAPFDTLFPSADGKPHTRDHRTWNFGNARDLDSAAFRSFRSHKLALYDGAIAFADAQLRRLSEELERLGVGEQTVWVIASDHGEEFWDSPEFPVKFDPAPLGRGAVGHGHSLLAEVLDVPLIMAGPGVPQARISQLVRNLDIAPTILGLAGVSAPAEFSGIDLLRAHRQSRLEDLPGLSEDIAYGHGGWSLQDGRYKYIVYPNHPERPAFLFDLIADPDETENLVASEPELAASLDERLSSMTERFRTPEREAAVMSTDMLKKLRALGYAH